MSFVAAGTIEAAENHFYDSFDRVYASAIFEKSLPIVRRIKQVYPSACIGGSALPKEDWNTLEAVGITTRRTDFRTAIVRADAELLSETKIDPLETTR